MKRYLTYSFLLSALLIGVLACKSSKNPITQTKQVSKEIENSNPQLAKGKKGKQRNEVDTVSNLKSLGDKKVYKDFKDSIENGIRIYVGNELVCYKLDSLPQILKDLFPEVYFFVSRQLIGYAPQPVLSAQYKNGFYGCQNIDELLEATSNVNRMSKEDQIRAYFAFDFFSTKKVITKIGKISRMIDEVNFEYCIDVNSDVGVKQYLFAFRRNGMVFMILEVTDNQSIPYRMFRFRNQ